MVYTQVHSLFLASLGICPVMKRQEASDQLKKICQHVGSAQSGTDVERIVKEINSKIKEFDQHISIVRCELTGESYYVLINENKAPVIRDCVISPSEMKILQKAIAEIVVNSKGCISTTEFLNLLDEQKDITTKTDASEAINHLCKRWWLLLKDGNLYLGVRSIADLEPYIVQNYKDKSLYSCLLCKKLMFYGFECPCCSNMSHHYCLKRYFKQRSPKCPQCKGDWSEAYTDQDT